MLVPDTFWVVEYTNGIVTVSKLNTVFVTFEVNPAAKMFVVVTELLTTKFDKVPTLVMFGWKAWETTSATFAFATFPTRFEELRFERPEAFPRYRLDVKIPETVRPVRVPTLVMFGWKAWETTSATFAFATLPTRFEALRFEIPEPLDTTRRPETVRPVRVPTLVMFGWDAWETTSATFAFATFPTRFEELRFERPEAFPRYRLDVKIPETVRPVRVPTLVMFGWDA